MYGDGSVTPKGYIRISGEMAHRRVWRKHHGPVSVGFFIHHIDGDKTNNEIANLALVDALTHKRIHSGCELRDGVWWKPCRACGEYKPVDTDYYKRKDGIGSECRACSIRRVGADKRRRSMGTGHKHT